MKKTALRLPKLKTRDELLRTAPELGRLLVADGEAPLPPPHSRTASPLRARSPTGHRAGSPHRIVRKFSDDELTEEERVVGAGVRCGEWHSCGEAGGRGLTPAAAPCQLCHAGSQPRAPCIYLLLPHCSGLTWRRSRRSALLCWTHWPSCALTWARAAASCSRRTSACCAASWRPSRRS